MGVLRDEPFLGREVRAGTWAELAVGTYVAALEHLALGDGAAAAALVRHAVVEAEELHDVYARWPVEVRAMLDAEIGDVEVVDRRQARIEGLAGNLEPLDFEDGWSRYVELTEVAATACEAGEADAAERVHEARLHWLEVHDRRVDLLYGMLTLAVELLGEDRLGEVWDHLMGEWYDAHCQRFDVRNQPWLESARQLLTAIADGFHAHLSGPSRMGDLEFVEEPGRRGYRFSPCGSGGRTVDGATTSGNPRPEPPYSFAVTTRRHTWAWNTEGICAYCVHCCLLNMVVPIDRIGYPTRVVEPPVWPGSASGATCTWWVYDDPSLVPDEVYERVGRRREGKGDS